MEKYKKLIYYFLLGIIGIALVFIFFKYILRVLLPFILSFLIVSLVRPIIDRICKKTKASKFFVTMFIIFLVVTLAITAIVLALGAIVEQVKDIFESIVENLSMENNYVTKLFEFIAKIEDKIPFISSITNESVYSLVTNMISEGAKSLSVRLTSQIARVIASLPQIMITIIVVFLSMFYFAKDYEKIGEKTVKFLPKYLAKRAPKIKNDIPRKKGKEMPSKFLALLLALTFILPFAFMVAVVIMF